MTQQEDANAPATELAELPDPLKRVTPRIKSDEDGNLSLKLEYNDQLRDLYGTKTRLAANGIFMTAANALGGGGEIYRDLMGAIGVEMEPRDALEAMLLSQQVATHVAMTMLSSKVMDANSPQLREGYERSMTRLSRTFLAQMDAFKKYRAKAQQTVRVERVTVNQGGQAIVGAVETGGRDHAQK